MDLASSPLSPASIHRQLSLREKARAGACTPLLRAPTAAGCRAAPGRRRGAGAARCSALPPLPPSNGGRAGSLPVPQPEFRRRYRVRS